MHNDTPLGTTMHLRELDQQVAPRRNPSHADRPESYPAAVLRRAVIALLRRLDGTGIPVRAANRV